MVPGVVGATGLRGSDAAVVAAGVVGVYGDRGGGAAAFAAPGLAAFFDRERGDAERDNRVGPPESEGDVQRQAYEHAGGEVGAEHVLGSFAGGGARGELGTDAAPGASEERHDEHAGDRQADPDPADAGTVGIDKGAQRGLGDIGGEQEEADRDEPLGALLGVVGEAPLAGEAPDYDDRCEALDRRVKAETEQRDGAGDDRGRDRDSPLDGHVREAQPRERLGATNEPIALVLLERWSWLGCNR